jgi:hypothetical protein
VHYFFIRYCLPVYKTPISRGLVIVETETGKVLKTRCTSIDKLAG